MSNTIIRVGEKGRDSRVPGGKLMKNKTKKKDVLNKWYNLGKLRRNNVKWNIFNSFFFPGEVSGLFSMLWERMSWHWWVMQRSKLIILIMLPVDDAGCLLAGGAVVNVLTSSVWAATAETTDAKHSHTHTHSQKGLIERISDVTHTHAVCFSPPGEQLQLSPLGRFLPK